MVLTLSGKYFNLRIWDNNFSIQQKKEGEVVNYPKLQLGVVHCLECNQVMNADVVGCLNIAKKLNIIPNPSWGRDNGVLTHPAVPKDCKPPRRLSFRVGRRSRHFRLRNCLE